MIYKYKGTNYHRNYILWRYYIRLAIKSKTVKSATRWTRLAKLAVDG